MDINKFIGNYKVAFSKNASLPVAFWYSETPLAEPKRINGCFFKGMNEVRDGKPLSLDVETIGCGGGKFYTGFTEMPEFVPQFVSIKEKYKETPEMVIDFIDKLNVPKAKSLYLNFLRIDHLEKLDNIEGLLFFVSPDILSGLATWAYFDNNSLDAITSIFGSGCSNMITTTVTENAKGGRRTFLGLFDPSARPYFAANELSLAIPLSRFKEMYNTMERSCLFDTHAWGKIKARINE